MNRNNQRHKKALTVFLFITLCTTLFAQQKPKKNNDFRNRDQFVRLYSDSVNNCFKSGSIIPAFLYNPNFDLKPIYWAGMHKPISLRYLVIKKIADTEILDYIIKNGDSTLLKALPKTDSPLPFKKYSFYDLILYRMSEIRNQENNKTFKK
jgi:hypothetical protein